MNFTKRITIMLMSIMLVFALVACADADTTDDTDLDDDVIVQETNDTTDTDLQPDTDTDEDVDVEATEDAMSDSMMVEASADSDYAGVTLTVDEAVDTVAPDGAEAGTLQLMVTFENTGDETVTLPFAEEDYVITDAGGLDVVPSTVSPELVMPEIEAGDSVSGTIEYAVTDAEGTYTFEVGDFEDVTFSSNASDG